MYLYIACVLFACLPFFDRRCSGSSSWVLSLQVVLQRMVSSYRKLRSCDPSLELHRVCFALVHANSLFHVQTMLTSLLYRCELIIPCLRCEQMDKTRVTHGETKYHAAWANSVGMLDKTPQRFWHFSRFFEISERGSILTYKLHVRLSLPCLLLMFFVTVCLLKDLAFCRVFYAAEGIWMCVMLAYLELMKMTDVVYSIMVPAFACFCWQTVWEIVYSNEQHVVLVGNSRYQISLKCVALTCSLQASLFSLQVSATMVPMSSVKLSSCASSFEVWVRSQVSNSWLVFSVSKSMMMQHGTSIVHLFTSLPLFWAQTWTERQDALCTEETSDGWQTVIFNISCTSRSFCRGCPWDLENCILVMSVFVYYDAVDLCDV